MERKVYKCKEKIISKIIFEKDYSNAGGGKLKKETILTMDTEEAERQMKWIEEDIKQSKVQLEAMKQGITTEGLKLHVREQRAKIKAVKEHIEVTKDLLCQYKKITE